MRRLRSLRVVHALLALWFAGTVGEPSPLRICPEHTAAARSATHAGHMAGMPDAADRSHGAAPASPGHHGDGHHHCSCISCCLGSASALAAPAVALQQPLTIIVAERDASNAGGSPRASVRHLLPPGTGPPRA